MKTIKTIKQLAAQSSVSEKLIRAVVRQFGGWDEFKEVAQDIANHGADSGWCGFTYHADTVPFFTHNRPAILELVSNMASELGVCGIDLVGGFRCLSGDYTSEEVAQTMYGPKTKADTQIANALAWFALEEVARAYSDALEG